ncbi:Ig-like protein group 3 [Archangium gephyra]|uniref:Ig-like protein group 3 n=1 Tax=Archangium gephyra TaxID=48 RepID=A0AAC8QG35_9BACT|nr:Ig-like domain-containing protein [Archangium gephyra]AKJ06805.1 PE family protein [Archangium gephyra]REG31899.1 Ig-like protein group 3 [Archangium gephyra]
MRALNALLALLVLGGASLASAESDTFFVGTGQTGFRSVTNTTVLNRYTSVNASGSIGGKSISVTDINGFAAGQLVMVLQTQGEGLGSSTPTNLDALYGGKTGQWEFARIESVVPDILGGLTGFGALKLTQPLFNLYDKEQTQVIYVPEYSSLYVSTTGVITADPWDGSTGGVIALLVRDTLINDGKIMASGVISSSVGGGFRGAPAGSGNDKTCGHASLDTAARGEGLDQTSYEENAKTRKANAGGGGECDQAGGGGGGSFGAGGVGGNKNTADPRGGAGGAAVVFFDFPGHLALGGGGGSGATDGAAGGRGGGAIYIRAGSLFGNGSMTADGFAGANSSSAGGGGGGAGGTIVVRVAEDAECHKFSAVGGKGGNAKPGDTSVFNGPGGGGGGGRILFQTYNAASCPAVTGGGTVMVNVAGGVPGESNDGNRPRGAAPGDPGDYSKINRPLTPAGDAVLVSPGPGSLINTKHPTIKVQAPAGRSVYLRINGGSRLGPLTRDTDGFYVYTSAVDYLSEDSNTVVAFAEYEGLWSPEHSTSFTVDTVAPTVSIESGPLDPTNARSARFAFKAVKTGTTTPEPGATFECSLDGDGTAWSACAQITTYDAAEDSLTETRHTLRVRALDIAGNKSAVVSYPWTFDWKPPTERSVNAIPAILSSKTYTFSGTAEANADVLVYINDEAALVVPADASGNWSLGPYSSLLENGNRIRVAAKDKAGNVSTLSDTVFFTVDTTPPTGTVISYPGEGAPIRDNPLVVWGSAESGTKVEVTIFTEGGGVAVGPKEVLTVDMGTSRMWRYEVSATLLDGTYVVKATARDAAGHPHAAPDRRFVLDRSPPNTTKTACPAAFTNLETVGFSFGSEDGSAVAHECAMEGAFATELLSPCPATLSKGIKPDGVYTLMARAKDAAGNVDPSPAVCTWVWDKKEPSDVTLPVAADRSYPPPSATDSKLAVFHFAASDVHSSPVNYECRLLDPTADPTAPVEAFHDCPNPYAISVEEGSHLLEVRAKDLAGNRSLGVTSHRWAVDTRLPIPVILPETSASNPTNARTAVLKIALKAASTTASEIDFYYTLKSGDLDPTTDFVKADRVETDPATGLKRAIVTLPLSEKVYKMQALARSTNPALNIETPRELWDLYEWRVDWSAPKVEIAEKPATWMRFPTATFVFTAPGEEELNVLPFLCVVNDCSAVTQDPETCTDSGPTAGRASYQVPEGALKEGRNCIQVWSQDKAGNLSSVSDSYEWNVDTQSPEPPVMDAFEGRLTVSTRIPSVEGTSEPFSDVAVLLDNAEAPVVWANANDKGRWKAVIPQEVQDGTHTLRAMAKDRAGNESVISQPITLLVDSQSPASVIGGGVGCSSSGTGGSMLALLGLARLLVRGGSRRRRA